MWCRRMYSHPPVTGYYVSTSLASMNVPWICATIRAQYWGAWLTDDKIIQAMSRSLCFGVFKDEVIDGGDIVVCGQQVAFARVLTDGETLSTVTDVVVDEAFRNQGIGTLLMNAVIAHELVRNTISVLQAKPIAIGWYSNFGYDGAVGVMKRDPR